MSIRIKKYYCPKCEQFKNSFQVTNNDAWDYDNCKCCGTECINVECLLAMKLEKWAKKERKHE